MPVQVQGPDGKTILRDIISGLRYKEIAAKHGLTRKQVKDRAAKLRRAGHYFVPKRAELPVDGMKLCVRCSTSKQIGEFYSRGNRGSSWCKSCARTGSKMRRYGITQDEIKSLPISDKCPLCDQAYTETLIPVIDHDHETGTVRGIICFLCNHALGRIADRSSTAERMTEYLRKHGR